MLLLKGRDKILSTIIILRDAISDYGGLPYEESRDICCNC